jgi:hypothetical protein
MDDIDHGGGAEGVVPPHMSLPEAAGASLIVTQGTEEVDASESRPVDVDEHELGVCRLPEEESREP